MPEKLSDKAMQLVRHIRKIQNAADTVDRCWALLAGLDLPDFYTVIQEIRDYHQFWGPDFKADIVEWSRQEMGLMYNHVLARELRPDDPSPEAFFKTRVLNPNATPQLEPDTIVHTVKQANDALIVAIMAAQSSKELGRMSLCNAARLPSKISTRFKNLAAYLSVPYDGGFECHKKIIRTVWKSGMRVFNESILEEIPWRGLKTPEPPQDISASMHLQTLGIVGVAPATRAFIEEINTVAMSERTTVFIQGESGTGKELAARAIHARSNRRKGPFIPVNCAAIPENMHESELFGHEKGSFTGASAKRLGHFAMANGGTIFLDEIGDMSLEAQAKLLRVLQEREITRVGASNPLKVDIRVIAATNHNLEAAVASGAFRGDLYYRLKVVPIVLPPLRDRQEDIPLLVNHFLAKYSDANGREIPLSITTSAMRALQQHTWPGNIRELENFCEYMVVMNPDSAIITQADIARKLPQSRSASKPGEVKGCDNPHPHIRIDVSTNGDDKYSLLERGEIAMIRRVLEQNRGNDTRAAAALGLTPHALGQKMTSYGINHGAARNGHRKPSIPGSDGMPDKGTIAVAQ